MTMTTSTTMKPPTDSAGELRDGPDFRIREATPADAEVVCQLVRELAVYERLADKAQPDPERLARHLSPEASPRCHALLATTAASESIGFALYFPTYSTFLTDWGVHLEDLYVRPDYRGRGVGDALLSAVARRAVDGGGNRVDLIVLDWNTPAINFYLNRGAVALDDWTTMRFDGTALRTLADGHSTG